MAIEIREAASREMKRNKKLVGKMSRILGFDENLDKVNMKRMRRMYDLSFAFLPREKGVLYKKESFGGVDCQITLPSEPKDEHILMYIHGGGFVAGSAAATKGYTSMLAAFSGRQVIAPEYRRAPDSPFPAGVNDCFEVYKAVIVKYPESRIVLLGDSAGGNLALVTALQAIDKGIKKPVCVITHSPVVDFSGSVDRTGRTIQDAIVKLGCEKPMHDMYVGGADTRNPYISPILGDYKEFPPVYITCDYNETLNRDAHALYQKVTESGGEATLVEVKNAYHAFGALAMSTPEMREICRETINLIEKCL